MVDGLNVSIHSYDGRLVSPIKYSGMRAELMNNLTASLSNDTLAIRSKQDEKGKIFICIKFSIFVNWRKGKIIAIKSLYFYDKLNQESLVMASYVAL